MLLKHQIILRSHKTKGLFKREKVSLLGLLGGSSLLGLLGGGSLLGLLGGGGLLGSLGGSSLLWGNFLGGSSSDFLGYIKKVRTLKSEVQIAASSPASQSTQRITD